jgi:membrane protease YdiL (CAAX protease family)
MVDVRREETARPWLKVSTTALIGASAILGSGATAPLLAVEALLWGLLGPASGLCLLLLSLLVTSGSLQGVRGAVRLLRHWSHLPAGVEPAAWSLLVVLAEEGLFRLLAFSLLPATWWAVALVSLTFGLVHLPRALSRRRPERIVASSALLSVGLCLAYLSTGSFWLVAGAHLTHNLALDRLRGALQGRRAEVLEERHREGD